MRKIKWFDLFLALFSFCTIFYFGNPAVYDSFVKHPLTNGSGLTGSRVFYLIMYKIDLYVGRTGVTIFFIILALFFLYHFFRENLPSIKNRYQDYKETGDWRKLF